MTTEEKGGRRQAAQGVRQGIRGLVGEGAETRVHYDLPDQRPALATIQPRALPARKRRRGKADHE